MGEFSQIQRLLRILQILSSGRKVTTTELLHRFDGKVSLRTLQRDLLALSEAGIPLISEKTMANENAWTLMSRFRSFIPMPLEALIIRPMDKPSTDVLLFYTGWRIH
jgi:predicted DNA-binding transcriptional regulator YafY